MKLGERESAKLNDMVELLGSVTSSTDTAIRILNDLLNYDKIKGTGLTLDCDMLPIWTMVRRVTEGFQIQAREKGVGLEFNLDYSAIEGWAPVSPSTPSYVLTVGSNRAKSSDEVTSIADGFEETTKLMAQASNAKMRYLDSLVVWIDVQKIEQVTRNLISNALKFTSSGGIVTVTGEKEMS